MPPPQAAIGVIGILLAAVYIPLNGCGGWRAGGQMRGGGGEIMGRGCGGLCSCDKKGRGCLGIVRAEGGCCGGGRRRRKAGYK